MHRSGPAPASSNPRSCFGGSWGQLSSKQFGSSISENRISFREGGAASCHHDQTRVRAAEHPGLKVLKEFSERASRPLYKLKGELFRPHHEI